MEVSEEILWAFSVGILEGLPEEVFSGGILIGLPREILGRLLEEVVLKVSVDIFERITKDISGGNLSVITGENLFWSFCRNI